MSMKNLLSEIDKLNNRSSFLCTVWRYNTSHSTLAIRIVADKSDIGEAFARVFDELEKERKPNADAICEMALENLGDTLNDFEFNRSNIAVV